MLRKWQFITMLLAALVLVVGIAITVAYFRGRHVGEAKQEGADRKEKVEDAIKRGDTDALDKEWEK